MPIVKYYKEKNGGFIKKQTKKKKIRESFLSNAQLKKKGGNMIKKIKYYILLVNNIFELVYRKIRNKPIYFKLIGENEDCREIGTPFTTNHSALNDMHVCFKKLTGYVLLNMKKNEINSFKIKQRFLETEPYVSALIQPCWIEDQ